MTVFTYWAAGLHGHRLRHTYNDFSRSCRCILEEETVEDYICILMYISLKIRFKFLNSPELRHSGQQVKWDPILAVLCNSNYENIEELSGISLESLFNFILFQSRNEWWFSNFWFLLLTLVYPKIFLYILLKMLLAGT